MAQNYRTVQYDLTFLKGEVLSLIEIFRHMEKELHNFMKANTQNPTAEYYIPDIVTKMISSGDATFNVIPTHDNWFGVTYKEDKQMAVDTINNHISAGVYPENLWS